MSESRQNLVPALALAIVGGLAASGTSVADWAADLDSLLGEQNVEVQAKLIRRVWDHGPGWEAVYAHLQRIPFEEPRQKGGLLLFSAMCEDSVERPYILYVPSDYSAISPTPLLIWLHGGAGWPDLPEDPVASVKERQTSVLELAEDRGWLVLFPFAQRGATWWDEVGIHNVLNQVRTLKATCNIDDDRVWLGGFSDGASAAYLFGMIVPNDFAAFVALNGHMGVGSLDGDLPTYANNMAATPVYAVNTGLDKLYPADVMRRTVAMARGAGADIYYKEYDEIAHEFTYADQELPLIADFLERHPRDPFPHALTWETADKEFGQCRWFRIDRPTTASPASWHADHNVAMVDDRVTFGFFHDAQYEGDGVKVQELIEDDCLARRLPLVAGDVIVRCNEKDIKTLDDLDEFKTTIRRGDRVRVRVMREGVCTDLAADMPGPAHYLLFKRHRPSAKAIVSFEANRVSVEGSRLGSFSLFFHPEMFHFDQKVVVEVDGEVVFDDFVEPDVEFMLRGFLQNRDRRLIYVAELSINLAAHD